MLFSRWEETTELVQLSTLDHWDPRAAEFWSLTVVSPHIRSTGDSLKPTTQSELINHNLCDPVLNYLSTVSYSDSVCGSGLQTDRRTHTHSWGAPFRNSGSTPFLGKQICQINWEHKAQKQNNNKTPLFFVPYLQKSWHKNLENNVDIGISGPIGVLNLAQNWIFVIKGKSNIHHASGSLSPGGPCTSGAVVYNRSITSGFIVFKKLR